jgi:hypothetical protein
MEIKDFILSVLDCQHKALTAALDGLNHNELTWRPGEDSNPIGFILWHQIRNEDYTQAMILEEPQVWIKEKWYEKFDMSDNPNEDGYGYTSEQVADFIVPELRELVTYAEATRVQMKGLLENLAPEDIDRVIKTPFWGEMSLSQIFASYLDETIQHTGQIAYLRGLQRGIGK